MSRFIQIKDEYSKILGRRFLNSQLSLYIGLIQLLICLWALTQHVYSILTFNEILFCDFSDNSTLPVALSGVDAIIFDIGLFHSLWGISGCVAQHLDGGYGRFAWCVSHTLTLLFCLPCAFMNRPKPYLLWPLLIQQSAYGIGLLILSLAALPRILPTFMGKLDNAPIGAILAYVLGTLMNFFLLFVYWHWYWYVESCYDSVRKVRTDRVIESHNRRTMSIRRPPVDPTPQKLLTNGCIETRTPLITKLSDGSMPNGIHAPKIIALNSTPISKPNGIIHANGHARTASITRPPIELITKPSIISPVMNSHVATLLDTTTDAQATLRRQSILLDELSPIESSASSLGSSSNSQQMSKRRRLPTIGSNYPYKAVRSPFMQSQSSTLSLPIQQAAGDKIIRAKLQNGYKNPNSEDFTYHEIDHRRGISSAREMRTADPAQYHKAHPYIKNRIGHRASLQQQQQIIEPHLRQIRRYQSHLANMSPSSPIVKTVPPPPAPPSPNPLQNPRVIPRPLRPMNSELPLRMAQYNCIQQKINNSSGEIEFAGRDAPSPRNQRFYSAAI